MHTQNPQESVGYGLNNNGQITNYTQYEAIQQIEKQNIEKYQKFKARIQQFENITTIAEAKELAKEVLRISDKDCSFKVGNARCVVISNENMFRISIDTPDEFISYDFA